MDTAASLFNIGLLAVVVVEVVKTDRIIIVMKH